MQQVRKGEELPEQPLKAFLQQHQLISDINSPLEVLQFSTGASNLTYLLKDRKSGIGAASSTERCN